MKNDKNLLLMLFWTIALVIEILYFLYKFLKTWFVLIIELIIARKEMKEDKE